MTCQQDEFGRTVSNGLGTADWGGAWTIGAGVSASRYQVTPGQATIDNAIAAGATSSARMALSQPTLLGDYTVIFETDADSSMIPDGDFSGIGESESFLPIRVVLNPAFGSMANVSVSIQSGKTNGLSFPAVDSLDFLVLSYPTDASGADNIVETPFSVVANASNTIVIHVAEDEVTVTVNYVTTLSAGVDLYMPVTAPAANLITVITEAVGNAGLGYPGGVTHMDPNTTTLTHVSWCTLPIPCGDTIETQDWNFSDNSYAITHFRGMLPSGPADDSYDVEAIGTFTGVPGAGIISYNNGIDEDYEFESRVFASNLAPGGATHARLRMFVFAGAIDTPAPVPISYIIYQGTWGSGTPSWASVGGILASGFISADDVSSDAIDVTLIVTDGYAQFIVAIGGQTEVNAFGGPFPPAIHSADRYPDLLSTDGDVDDGVATYHPDESRSSGDKLYQMDFYEACSDVVLGPCGCSPFNGSGTPLQNQPVQDELVGTGDGATTLFTTDWVYNPMTLQVEVSGLLGEVDMTDPAAKQFTLLPAPPSGAPIYATYRAA